MSLLMHVLNHLNFKLTQQLETQKVEFQDLKQDFNKDGSWV